MSVALAAVGCNAVHAACVSIALAAVGCNAVHAACVRIEAFAAVGCDVHASLTVVHGVYWTYRGTVVVANTDWIRYT